MKYQYFNSINTFNNAHLFSVKILYIGKNFYITSDQDKNENNSEKKYNIYFRWKKFFLTIAQYQTQENLPASHKHDSFSLQLSYLHNLLTEHTQCVLHTYYRSKFTCNCTCFVHVHLNVLCVSTYRGSFSSAQPQAIYGQAVFWTSIHGIQGLILSFLGYEWWLFNFIVNRSASKSTDESKWICLLVCWFWLWFSKWVESLIAF